MRLIPQALRNLAAQVAKAVAQEKQKGITVSTVPGKKAPPPVWTTYGFIRWRSNPNWPGRRAAAARRTAGKTRRMR